mmetsp:Transcript_14868/g.48513  ORF Transcript_14868/g.48513 Transcript_14868/m.48513 type:complete len:370 (-) Transcript_14868:1399-2508(-)
MWCYFSSSSRSSRSRASSSLGALLLSLLSTTRTSGLTPGSSFLGGRSRRRLLLAYASPRRGEPDSRVKFPELVDSQFRHPLDRDLTDAVKRSPVSFFESFARNVGSSTVEESLRLDNLAFSLRVSESQLPRVYALFREAAAILGLEKTPELYVRQDPRPNAYTLAVDGKSPFVVLTSSLVDLVSERELQAVMGHELGHLKCEHSLWLLLGQIAASVSPPFVDDILATLLRRWRKAAEYTCDRAALLVVQDPHVVVAALIKLVSGLGGNKHGIGNKPTVSADAFLRQAEDYERALKSANPLVRNSFRTQVAGLSHPLPIDRVLELRRWAHSSQFKALIANGKPQRAPPAGETTPFDDDDDDSSDLRGRGP